jgi:hypothetical protein
MTCRESVVSANADLAEGVDVMPKYLGSIGAAAIVLAVTAVGLVAQSEAPKQSGGAALGGYCPVAYIAMNQAVKGDPRFKSEYQGRT